MLRATFFAAGLFIALVGASCLAVDKVVLTIKEDKPQVKPKGFRGLLSRVTTVDADKKKVVDPPDWAAFSLLSIGGVTLLYAAALPRTGKARGEG